MKKLFSKAMYVSLGFALAFAVTATAYVANFPDVPEGAFFTKPVQRFQALGVIQGYSDGTFRPANYVNRAELATILDRYDQAMGGMPLLITGIRINESKDEASPPRYNLELLFKTTKSAKSTVQISGKTTKSDGFDTEHKHSISLGVIQKSELPKVFLIDITVETQDGESLSETRQYVVGG